ncbi:hypothetical protein Pdca_05910 [Pseudonocardia autotrophica]|nr:hypothetical protein Pdca_05910 [Pseudonocardia autotrophica]
MAELESWMAPVPVELTVPTPGAEAFLTYEAKGTVLLFGPWNFPFHLIVKPLVAMIAAGNTVVVKPSEMAPATSALVAGIIRDVFPEEEVAVFEGDIPVATALLEKPFDHMFMTGSPNVGKVMMTAAAKHLASVTLELGGKNPAILDGTADLELAARQLATGRTMNGGQVCLSTDYVLVPNAMKDELISRIAAAFSADFYTDGEFRADAGARFVDRRNFERVTGYLDDAVAKGATVHAGGGSDADRLVLEPTVVSGAPLDSDLMREEIFGPIVAVVGYDDLSEALELIHSHGKPLGMCVFSRDDEFVRTVLAHTSSGGVSVNNWSGNYFDDALPFGGTGASGIGRYHSVHGFRELSHERAVFRTPA